ncbi:hypothetical protein [Nonomuraea sp. LPB2021202275-12-8]|uniref:hypothetical protein n=1 Tax=Nonomuraea sp. LPB2021202275-12-8 TaxID=3120159 RepID=UPI00300C526D
MQSSAASVRVCPFSSHARATTGSVAVLHDLAVAGDHQAGLAVADWCAEQGRMDELRILADAGVGPASRRLCEWLTDIGRVDELKLRTLAGDYSVRVSLVRMAETAEWAAGRNSSPEGSNRTGPSCRARFDEGSLLTVAGAWAGVGIRGSGADRRRCTAGRSRAGGRIRADLTG